MSTKTPLRAVPISQDAMERIKADLDMDNPEVLAELLEVLLKRISLRRVRAWEEIYRVADINRETEVCRVSYVSNEILVYAKGPEDEYE